MSDKPAEHYLKWADRVLAEPQHRDWLERRFPGGLPPREVLAKYIVELEMSVVVDDMFGEDA